MSLGAPVLDSGKLRASRLLKRKTRLKFYRVRHLPAHLDSVGKTIIGRSIGVYIHVPFCRSVCMFCPYFREVIRDYSEVEKYFRALLREVELYGRLLEGRGLSVVEVHVGGGTPSVVQPRMYRELTDALSHFFDVKCGIGIEANPEDLRNRGTAEELHSVGVDEVSIGVQSFNRRVLKSLGRKHSPEDSVKAVENSLKAGFKWVNADLMFLAPSVRGYAELALEEKLEAFRGDLEKCYELGVHQATFYPTVVPKGSPGYRLAELGRASQELNFVDAFIDSVLDFAEGRDLHLVRVYSVSRKRYEYATVNLEMVGSLLGFGAGAWSNTGLYQYVNVHDIATYVSTTEKALPPAEYSRSLSNSSRAWRLFFDQLSAVEIREEVFKKAGFRGMPIRVKLLLKAMELNGIAERVGGTYRLTRHGIKEVYKSVINYVVEIPVKATEVFTQISKSGSRPEVVEIR